MKKNILFAALLALSLNVNAQTLQDAKALHEEGRKCLNEGKIAQGRELTKQAMDIRKKLSGDMDKDYITSLNNYAYTFALEKNFAKATELQEQVMALCEKLPKSHKNLGMYAFNMGRFYFIADNYEGAAKYLEMALPLQEKYSEPYENCLQWLGLIYVEKKDIKNQQRIMQLTEDHNQHELTKECNEPKCMLERAQYYASKGNTAKAKECFLNVLDMKMDDGMKVSVYDGYASFLSQNKDWGMAANYKLMAAQIMKKAQNQNFGCKKYSDVQYMAGLYSYLAGQYQQSIDCLNEAVNIYKTQNDSTSLLRVASCHKSIGNAYSAQKQYPKAIEAYQKCVDYYKQHDIQNAEYPKVILRLAKAEKFNKDYEQSVLHHKQAIKLFEERGMNQDYTEAVSSLKLCYTYMGVTEDMDFKDGANITEQNKKLDRIITDETSNLEMTQKYLGKLAYANSLSTIAGSYALKQDYVQAVAYYKQYIPALREAISEEFRMQSEAERMLTWREEVKGIQAFLEMMALLPVGYEALSGDIAALAYDAELLSKGILLNSSIEFGKLLAQKGNEQLKKLYDKIKLTSIQVKQLRDKAKTVEECEKVSEIENKNKADEFQLLHDCAEYADFTNYIMYDWHDVQKKLFSTDVAIEFVAIKSDVFDRNNFMVALVVDSQMKTPISFPVCTLADANIMQTDSLLLNRPINLVWGAIAKHLEGKKRLFFSADGVFNHIAIEYLQFNGKPLSEQMEVYRLSTTKELCYNHPHTIPTRAMLYGGIDYNMDNASEKEVKQSLMAMRNGGDGDLKYTTLGNTLREVNEIKKVLEQAKLKNVAILKDANASKNSFLQLTDTRMNILHLATHGAYKKHKGITDSESMDNSVLAFAGANVDEENEVSASEVAQMNLRQCDLVVLSACESGLGKLGQDGVFGLQRGFKNAGVNTLLMSLCTVNDSATADLMVQFYRNMMNGMSKRESLVEAQKGLRAKGYTDAKYWTSFILLDALD